MLAAPASLREALRAGVLEYWNDASCPNYTGAASRRGTEANCLVNIRPQTTRQTPCEGQKLRSLNFTLILFWRPGSLGPIWGIAFISFAAYISVTLPTVIY